MNFPRRTLIGAGLAAPFATFTKADAMLPCDAIDFANPMPPARPAPEGRGPNAYFSFWAVSAGPQVRRAFADHARSVLRAAA